MEGTRAVERPEQLIEWLEENDILLSMTEQEAEVLLRYLTRHDYRIVTDGKKLFWVDSQNKNEAEETRIDDVINQVMEWNYELLEQAKERVRLADDFLEHAESQEDYFVLSVEEMLIDRLFDRTCYGKQINELGERLAMKFIANMQEKGMDEAVKEIAEAIRNEEPSGRGR